MLNYITKTIQDAVRTGSINLRSTKWPEVEKQHLKLQPTCQACGSSFKLQVHHKMPFHINPKLELDPNNLITLCENFKDGVECHLHIGHLGNWKNYNPNVVADAARKLNFNKNVPH